MKYSNEYAKTLGETFEKAPKTVIAAVAVSVLTEGGRILDQAEKLFLNEWKFLYQNRIVPQKPPRAEGKK